MKSASCAGAIIAAFCLIGGMYGPAIEPTAAATAPQAELSSGLQTFTRFYNLVERNFAENVSAERALFQGAIPGMLRTLDPHSAFIDPKSYRQMQQDQQGQYYGVGMTIISDGTQIIVDQPFQGSPAWKEGIRHGDIIVSVDDTRIGQVGTREVAEMLRGPRGAKVTVGIHREGVERKLSFLVTRDEIVHSNVSTFWLQSGVAYVRIVNFSSQTTGADVEAGLKALGEDNIKGLILDLRSNPGGLVNGSVSVAGHFLERGQTVVSVRGRASAEQVYRVKTQNPSSRKYPIVVLVDRYSASASEIVAGALQDHDRAWILGENTFGKGLVQGTYPLSEGAALLLTTARYHTPSGRLIQRDYEHRSFFDYYSHRDTDARNPLDAQQTDSGRTVYGGGGITPDEKYVRPAWTPLQSRLANHFSFLHFAAAHFAGRTPELPRDWKPDEATLEEFQKFAGLDADELKPIRDWISDQLRIEMYTWAYDRSAADRLSAQLDPEVRKGLASLPAAQALLEDARRVLARRR
jgi:carboxyl-terminal processing protease